MHYHSSEYWIVVHGTAKITNGEMEVFINENKSVYIPKATLHCLKKLVLIPLELIEAQCGSYPEEDDIIKG